jgi:plasmid stabilization system protein ParE
MPPPRLEIVRRAVEEARAARRRYARRSATAAAQFDAELDDAVNRTIASPGLGSPYLFGTRFFRVGQFPYLVVYTETPSLIRIVAVAHTSRRPGYWRRRIP